MGIDNISFLLLRRGSECVVILCMNEGRDRHVFKYGT